MNSERPGTDAALSALLKRVTAYSVSSSPGNLASYRKTAVSLPSGVQDCPHILEVVGSTGRWFLEEEQKRMRRDPEEIDRDALPSSLQWPSAQEEPEIVPLLCARSEVTRHAVRDPVSIRARRYVFVHKSNGALGFGRNQVALPKRVDVDSEED